jgi:prephenate dehydrogenase
VQFEKVAIVGVGLLGGSLGQALRKRRLARHVVGCVRRHSNIAECRRARAADRATMDLAAGVAGADLVVLCPPIGQMAPVFERLMPHLKRGAIVTDVGSVKASVVRELEPLAAKAGAHFVGSHPLAGSEKTGVAAAVPDLYLGALCVVTPTPRSHRPAVKAVTRFWEAVGARVLELNPQVHDQLVARSSHLPHLLAAQLVNHSLGGKAANDVAALCATGFRDATRIASGSPEMWRDIAIANRRNLARELRAFIAALRRLQRLVQTGGPVDLSRFFVQAKQRRDAWCAAATTGAPSSLTGNSTE